MAVTLVEPFNNLTAWTNVGSAAVSGTRAYRSGSALLLDCTGTTKYISRTPAGGTRIIVGRFIYNLETAASGAASVMQVTTSGGTMTLQARPLRPLRTFIAVAGTDSAVLDLDRYYLIDFMCRSDSGTHSIDYSIDLVAQVGQTIARTAADFTLIQIGNTASNTYKIWIDEYLEMTGSAADYQIGYEGLQLPWRSPYHQYIAH